MFNPPLTLQCYNGFARMQAMPSAHYPSSAAAALPPLPPPPSLPPLRSPQPPLSRCQRLQTSISTMFRSLSENASQFWASAWLSSSSSSTTTTTHFFWFSVSSSILSFLRIRPLFEGSWGGLCLSNWRRILEPLFVHLFLVSAFF